MRKTIFKGADWANDLMTYDDLIRKSELVAPMLVEFTFYDPKTGEKINSDYLHVAATPNASLKVSLKSAMELLAKGDKVLAKFEFKGVTIDIRREDKFEDVYCLIDEIFEFIAKTNRVIEEKRNPNENNL